MPWRLEISRRAAKDIDALPPDNRRSIQARIQQAAENPGAADLAKLAGREGQWRLRVGRWRVILKLDSRVGTITVVRVLARKDAY